MPERLNGMVSKIIVQFFCTEGSNPSLSGVYYGHFIENNIYLMLYCAKNIENIIEIIFYIIMFYVKNTYFLDYI